MKNSFLVTAGLILIIQGSWCSSRVKVDMEVVAYPNESATIRCQFVDSQSTKLTQVSWIWESAGGERDNIAVFHPSYGKSFPDSPFKGRVEFVQGTLENPSIQISDLRMADAGRYTCEYATYPSGNEQATTTLVMLAKPRNSAASVTVPAGSAAVVVARCVAAGGKPAANITWTTAANGNTSSTPMTANDGTVTVTSEYSMVPGAADHGKDISCTVSHRAQGQPQVFPMKLSVEYPPTVTIDGFDNNWYIGRTNAFLVCQTSANPEPASITWTAVSGKLPDTVEVVDNKLKVRKVDEAVNTTFVCEATNRLGVSRQQVTTAVIEEERAVDTSSSVTGAVIGGIVGLLILLAVIGGVIALVVRRKRDMGHGDGPPKHKPPPPVKAASSTEMLNKPASPPTETQPLSNIYYETSGEPVTDLDICDDNETAPANGGAPSSLEHSMEYADEGQSVDAPPDFTPPPLERSNLLGNGENQGSAAISREESFVSPPMYV